MLSMGYAYILSFHIEIKAIVTTVSADATHLNTAKGGGEVAVILRINPEHTSLYPMC